MMIERGKTYKISGLNYRGLEAQLPEEVDIGYKNQDGTDSYLFEGDMIYRLLDFGHDINSLSKVLYGKELHEISVDMSLFDVKIWDITDPQVKEERIDFRTINYRTDLTTTLYPNRTMVKGEIKKVDWYSDPELTDKILTAEISYTRDQFGFAVERTTTRKWVMTNGEYHNLVKITKKKYDINPIDQIKEGKVRRGNIVDAFQTPVLAAMIEILVPQGHSHTEVLLRGRKILDGVSLELKNFIDNSSTVTNESDPNFGRKVMAVKWEELAATTEPWMKEPSQTLGGTTPEQYLVNEFSI